MNNLIKFIGIELITIQIMWSNILMFSDNHYFYLFNIKIHTKSLLTTIGLGTSLCVIYRIDNYNL